jgi:hypothetical protein
VACSSSSRSPTASGTASRRHRRTVDFFTNDVVLGYDSPQTASTIFADETTAIWQVQDGGRIGGVFGEDAVQALEEAGPAAIEACPHQTP